MSNRNRSPIGRRVFLSGLGATGALTLSGCTLFGGGTPTTRTVIQEAPPPVDPLLTLLAMTRLHLARIDSILVAVAADQNAVNVLTPLRADRAAHLEILRSEEARSVGSVLESSSGETQPQLTVPGDTAAAVALLRSDAETAQLQFSDGVSATGRYRAAIFASISACLATHRSVLA